MNNFNDIPDDLASNYPNCNYYTIDDFVTQLVNNSSSEKNIESDTNPFSLFHVNSRSLNKNFDALETLLSGLNFKFSVIGVTETWLHENSPPLFDIPGY